MDPGIKKLYRNTHTLKDDTFNVEDLDHYDLLLLVSREELKVAVTDIRTNRCLFLDHFEFQGEVRSADKLAQLQVIVDEHHLLKANFWNAVRIAFKEPDFTLIPKTLFVKEEAAAYLTHQTGKDVIPDAVRHYPQAGCDAVNVFMVQREILELFTKVYINRTIEVLHHTAALIEGVLRQNPDPGEPSVFISVDKDFFTMLVTRDKKLVFANTFEFASTNDLIYFVMFVLDELKLDPEVVKVTLWGGVTPDSVVFAKLYKYVRNVNFGKRPSSLKFGYKFDEVMDHRHFDLFCLHLCE